MKFSPTFIDRVCEANDLVDVVSAFTNLKSRDLNQFQGRCPFPSHNDSSPSFSVSRSKQIYRCFGCGKSGNIFTFLKDYHGLSFPDSVASLARRAGIELPKNKKEKEDQDYQKHKKEKEELYEIQKIALEFFQKNLTVLPAEHPVHSYIKTRGITPASLKSFKIGYAPKDWNQLCEKIKAKGLSMSLASQSGLIKKGDKAYYDVFRHRLMFPIFSAIGECIGFGGRSLDKDSHPKYINSSNSPIFHKGKNPYHGPTLTLPFLREKNQVLLVEGYMDLIQLYQAGIKNVLATLGTALTEDHCKSIKKSCQKVVLFFDGILQDNKLQKKALTSY